MVALLRRIENFTPDEVDVAIELLDEAIARPLQSGYRCIVAVEPLGTDEARLGYLCYGKTPMTEHTYDLYWIAVDPIARGRGIGKALHGAFETTIVQEGAKNIRVETSKKESYDGTLRFYLDLSYIECGRIPDFYRDGDDLVTLLRRVGV